MSIAIVAATQFDGVILVHEKMFESRMFFVDKLVGMGRASSSAIRTAPSSTVRPSYGPAPSNPRHPRRHGHAARRLAARGTSTINNVGQIERGYERIATRLRSLGARIEAVQGRWAAARVTSEPARRTACLTRARTAPTFCRPAMRF